MTSKRMGLFLLAALAASAIIAAAFLSMRPAAPPLERFVLGVFPGMYSLLPAIAEDQGFFVAEGLDVDMRRYGLGLAALAALESGEVEAATAADVAVAVRGMKRGDLRILASIATSSDVAVLGRRDLGVGSPQDLVGERVGVPRDSTGDHYLSSFAAMNGIPANSLERVDLSPGEAVEALADGRLRAIVVWDRYVPEAERRLGDKLVVWPAREDQKFYWLLVSDERTAVGRPEALRRLLRALAKAGEFARRYPDRAKRIAVERYGVEPAFADSAWNKSNFALQMDQAMIISMEDAALWRLGAGSGSDAPGSNFPNYFGMIYFDAMDAAAPRAVTVFR